jgi:glycerol transport system ATP-binding protein
MTLELRQVESLVGRERILFPLDLALEPGSINVLLGPIRAGKTSLMRLMAGLDRPTGGRIRDEGRDVTGLDVRKRSASMVYQQFINYPNFTVFDNIASPLRVRGGHGRDAIEARVRDMAGRLGLTPLLGRLPAELSGGQQQRTALARAMVTDSRLLLLDEPLVNLDYKLREDLRAEMKDLFRQGNRIVVYATTEPLEALMLGGRTIVLREGRLLQEGPALDVYRRPETLEIARLISDPPMNLLSGAIADGVVRIEGGAAFPAPAGLSGLPAGSYTFGLHAAEMKAMPFPGAVDLPVVVDLAEINGSETLVHGSYGGAPVMLQREGVHAVEIGSTMVLRFDPAALYGYDAAGRLARAPRFDRNPEEVRLGADTAA